MATVRPLVLSVSLDNEEEIRRWVESVQARCRALQDEIDAVVDELRNAPHIAITLTSSKPNSPRARASDPRPGA